MKNDTILSSPSRSTQDLLQRYVLALLYYVTNGPNWFWSQPYLSSKDVCLWNNRTENYGVYCQSDNESIDELKLSSNGLSGQLPRELGLLTNLTIVHLDFNQLTGTIPTELGRLESLEELQLSSNRLSGQLPRELGLLTNLVIVHLPPSVDWKRWKSLSSTTIFWIPQSLPNSVNSFL
jgi:Leucine-rich repeat (LRR) protein